MVSPKLWKVNAMVEHGYWDITTELLDVNTFLYNLRPGAHI